MDPEISGSDYISEEQVDNLRGEHETDEHWELRREFLASHHAKFTYSRLLSLSQTYCNIEILGCRYIPEIMTLIGELSKDLGQDRRTRKEQDGAIHRHMVDASSAAEQKIRSRTRGPNQQAESNQPKIVYGPPVASGPRITYGPPVSANTGGESTSRYGGVRSYSTDN